MNKSRNRSWMYQALLIILIFVLTSFPARAQQSNFEQDPVFQQIGELYQTLDQGMSRFRDLKYNYDGLLWQTHEMQLLNHYQALEACRETMALGTLDTEAILQIQQQNNGQLTPLDLVSRINPSSSVLPGSKASIAFHETINAFTDANSDQEFIKLFFLETKFQASLAEAYAAFQSSLDLYLIKAPEIETIIDKKESEYSQFLAAALVLLSHRMAQNSRAITYFEKYESLIGTIDEPDILESVYGAAIHFYTVGGQFEKAAKFKMLLNSPQPESAAAEAKIMGEYMDSVKASGGASGNASAMDESYFYEEPAAFDYNQINLKINNITLLQVEVLSSALWNLPGLLDISTASFSQNKASLSLTVSDLDTATLVSFLNDTEFPGFLIDAVAGNDTEVTADALGVAREQFNVLAPLFEYIMLPDASQDFSAAGTYARVVLEAYAGQDGADNFRWILLKTFESAMARAAGDASFFQTQSNPSTETAQQFPRLAMLMAGTMGLAHADAGDFISAFSKLALAEEWIPIEDPQPFVAGTTRGNYLALAVQTDNGAKGLGDAMAQEIDEVIQSAKNDEIRLRLGIIKGNYLYQLKRYEEAESSFEEMRGLAGSYTNLSGPQIYAILGIGNCAIMMNQHSDAENAYSEAAEKAQKAGNPLLEAMALSHLGRVRLFLGNYPGAVESSRRASNIAGQFALDSLKWESQYTLARALEAQDMRDESLEAYLKAIEILETSMSASSDPVTSGNDAEDVYRYAVALCTRMGRTETALEILERSRALSIKLEYEKSRVAFQEPEKQRAAQQIESLKHDMSGIQLQIQEQASAPPETRSEGKTENLKQHLQDTQRDYIKYVTDLERTSPELASLYKIEPVELVKIRMLLPDDMAVVYYLIGDDALYIFFVRSDRLGFRQVQIDGDTLTTQIKLMRSIISKPSAMETGEDAADKRLERFRKGAGRLYDILFKPIVPELEGISRVAILPNGILNFIPFQALVTSDGSSEYLVQKYSIFYLDTLAAVNNMSPAARREDTPLYAFGNADDTLPEAELEVDALKKMFQKANIFLRGQATEVEAKKLSGNVGIFHFATHGILDFKDISQSYIVLAPTPSEQEDGHFTIEEVWGYWWGESVLISLSACSTALGELTVRGKAVHPASAFLNAGASSVLATLWNVDDAATSLLMQNFYQNLNTMGKSDALRKAQLDLLGNSATANPYYWAPFMLIGDWR